MKPKATKFVVMDEYSVAKYECDEPHIVISIRSPSGERVRLPKNDLRMDTLWLAFHDVDDTEGGQQARHMIKVLREEPVIFSLKMARKVLDFVERNAEATTIVVNCEAGISRSAGVAASLSKVLTGDDEEFFRRYCPNTTAYKKIMKEAVKKWVWCQ